MKSDSHASIDWTARILDGWATFAVGLLGAGCIAGLTVPALYRLFGALTLALTLPGLH